MRTINPKLHFLLKTTQKDAINVVDDGGGGILAQNMPDA